MLIWVTAQKSVVRRIKESGKVFDGRLSFFNDWELFWSSGMFAIYLSLSDQTRSSLLFMLLSLLFER